MVRRLLPLAALMLAPVASASAPSRASRAWIAQGSLTAPSARDAESIARDALASHLPWTRPFALVLDRIDLRDDGSRIVRFDQEILGFPVLSRGARVLVEVDGTARLATAVLEERALAVAAPTIDAELASRIAARGGALRFDARRAAKVVVPGPRLAWALPALLPPEIPARPFALVDATRGTILARGDRARAAKQVRVYETNPVVSKLATFTLASLPDGAKTLSAPRWNARSCVDRKRVVDIDLGSPVPMHVCTFEQLAPADAAGDFIHPPPADDAAVDDAFAETSIARHVDRALGAFSAMGLSSLRPSAQPLSINANVRMPPSWEAGPIDALRCASCALERLDNAFFSPSSELTKSLFDADRDGLFFGQGATLDYAYDGDVVYHELGHAVIESTARFVSFRHIDAEGVLDVTGLLHEGFADYFAAAISGDPRVGEYASGGGSIRDLSEAHRCPERLVNEAHHDSLILSSSLWSARTGPRFDRGVMLALQMAPARDPSLAEISELLVKAMTTEDPAAAKALSAVLAERVSSCRRVRELPEGGTASFEPGFLNTPESSVRAELSAGIVPGAVQFHRALPPNTTAVTIQLDSETIPASPAWIGGDPFLPVLLVKWGSPIAWTDGATGWRSDHALAVELTEPGAFVRALPVPAGATDVYVMIGSRGDGGGVYNNVRVEPRSDPRPIADSGAIPIADAPPGDAEIVPHDDILNGRACTCGTPGARPSDAGAWVLLLIGLGARRRVTQLARPAIRRARGVRVLR